MGRKRTQTLRIHAGKQDQIANAVEQLGHLWLLHLAHALLHGCRKKGVQLPYNTIARPTVRDRDGRQIILLQFNLGHCRKTP